MRFNFNPKILDQYRLGWHLLFWTIYVLAYTFMHGSEGDRYFIVFVEVLMELPLKLVAVYAMLYWIMPAYLFKNRIASFAVLTFITLAVTGFFEWLVIYHFIFPLHDHPHDDPLISVAGIVKQFVSIGGIVGVAAGIKLLKSWYRQKEASQELEREKLEAELKFLKAQVNPHVLFNTLNTLYSLALDKAEETPEVVLKLSELLNYILYECNGRTIALQKEIDILQTYLSLQQLRYGERLHVNFEVNGNINNKQVPPLLIFPLVENSFKHGVDEHHEQAVIDINIAIGEQTMTLIVENSKAERQNKGTSLEVKEGIGIKNLSRRLDLLFPNSQNLHIENKGDTYKVRLTVGFNEGALEVAYED